MRSGGLRFKLGLPKLGLELGLWLGLVVRQYKTDFKGVRPSLLHVCAEGDAEARLDRTCRCAAFSEVHQS